MDDQTCLLETAIGVIRKFRNIKLTLFNNLTAEISNHLRMHAGVAGPKCEICEKRFESNTALTTYFNSQQCLENKERNSDSIFFEF